MGEEGGWQNEGLGMVQGEGGISEGGEGIWEAPLKWITNCWSSMLYMLLTSNVSQCTQSKCILSTLLNQR